MLNAQVEKMEASYNVVVTGKVVDGFDLAQVKANFRELFKLDQQQVDKLLVGKPVAIRRGVNKQQALKLRNSLLKAGAITVVKVAAEPAAKPSASPAASPANSATRPAGAGTQPAASTPPATKPAPSADTSGPKPKFKVTNSGYATAEPKTASGSPAVKAKQPASQAPIKEAAKQKPVQQKPVQAQQAADSASTAQAAAELDCPRCGHQQAIAKACERCRMDLRLHLKRLQRKQKIRSARQQQAQVV